MDVKLKPYCKAPCTFYGYESNYKFCKACDGSDKKLLEAFMRKGKEKKDDIKQWIDLTSGLMNDPITERIKEDISMMVVKDWSRRIEEEIRHDIANPVFGKWTLNEDVESLYPKYGLGIWPKDNPHLKAHFSGPQDTWVAEALDTKDGFNVHQYIIDDIVTTKNMYKTLTEMEENDMNHTAYAKGNDIFRGYLAIEKVHFSGPVTAVIWNDHTKTVVRCQDGEDFDPEKGLAMAIAKKMFGNKGSYYDVFKEWIPEEEVGSTVEISIKDMFEKARDAVDKLSRRFGDSYILDRDKERNVQATYKKQTCHTCKHYDEPMGVEPCMSCEHYINWESAKKEPTCEHIADTKCELCVDCRYAYTNVKAYPCIKCFTVVGMPRFTPKEGE
jgi:hypothetical protein